MAFWKRKKHEDRFVTLGLSGTSSAGSAVDKVKEVAITPAPAFGKSPPRQEKEAPIESVNVQPSSAETPAKTPTWQTSVLGLDLSIEEL